MSERGRSLAFGVRDRSRRAIKLSPAGKDYLWGGRRLRDDFSKDIDMSPLAETWECSTHPDGQAIVVTGRYEGRELSECLAENPDWLGSHPSSMGLPEGQIPILVKLIDAKQDLSVQVHPDDGYASEHEGGQLGKTEAWYVVDALRDARLVYGLREDVTADEMRRYIDEGTLQAHLQSVSVHKDDVFFIPPGTIHAIGAGCLVAEVQESSNLTYRLYDYDRVDRDGCKRELHVDKALDVANLKSSASPVQPMRTLRFSPGYATELLCTCRYFQMERLILNTERIRQMVAIRTSSLSFEVLLCIEGCGMMMCGEESMPFFKGDCFFLPANSEEVRLHGVGTFLKVRC